MRLLKFNKVYERANYECELCDRGIGGLQEHHIVKRSQGGKDNPANRILLCWECHHGTAGIHGRDGHRLDKQLKIGLQKFYEWQGRENIKELMGQRFYPGSIEIKAVERHFEKLKKGDE